MNRRSANPPRGLGNTARRERVSKGCSRPFAVIIIMFGICTAKWASSRPYLSGRRRPLRQGSRGGSGDYLNLLYADDLVQCGESEEDLRAIVRHFAKVYMRGLKVNAGKSKVMLLGGE